MRQPYDDAVSARFNIARLEDIITGLQLLLPVAEHRDRCVEITELEREKSALQPRIDTLDRRYRELIAQTRDLPDPMASFLGSPAPHPKVVEKNRVGAELRSLESSRDGIDFSIAAAKQRCADLERAHPDAITEGCDGSKRAAA
ncbi:MAG TPA: hypothetical protein VJP85_05610 [Candidatus Baltobacteraceae bacterium]|nr:hypothetical protein [Candidatus Baltobacteraceae bacterium]